MKKRILLLLILTCLTSCAREIESDLYTDYHVGEVSTTYAGVIKGVRSVNVQKGETLEENELGLIGGGVAGGALGGTIGKGHLAPTAIGMLAGAVAGTFAEKQLKKQTALEYIVQLDNGNLMTVVQGKNQLFEVGQPIYVIVGQKGRSRITPQ